MWHCHCNLLIMLTLVQPQGLWISVLNLKAIWTVDVKIFGSRPKYCGEVWSDWATLTSLCSTRSVIQKHSGFYPMCWSGVCLYCTLLILHFLILQYCLPCLSVMLVLPQWAVNLWEKGTETRGEENKTPLFW